VSESQYKYLFKEVCGVHLIKSTNSNHEFHAINVTGICGRSCARPVGRSFLCVRTHNHDDANDRLNLITTNPVFGRGGGRGGRGRGSGGRGGAKYERPVLQRTTTNPLTVFKVVSKRDKARHVI
jgi:hypothetical protein